MTDEFTVPIDEPRPSQLFVDAERLAGVFDWFDVDDPAYDPIPVLPRPNEDGWYLTDGHTRAFVAWLAGAEDLRVVRDPDAADLSLGVYERCLAWCDAEGVREVGDLAGRVVGRDRFLEEWVRRCHALPEHPGDPSDVDDYG